MSTPLKKPNDAQILAWIKANPDATDDEIRAYATGKVPPPVSRFKQGVQSFGRNAAQMFTGGLADEAVGVLESVPRLMPGGESFGDAVKRNIGEERALDKQVTQAAPVEAFVGNVAGGVTSGLAAGKIVASKSAALATLLGRAGKPGQTLSKAVTATTGSGGIGGQIAGQGIAGGAGAGTMAFGQAEGSPLERLDDAGLAGLLGAAAGAAFPVVGGSIRAVGNAVNIRPPFVNPARESADVLNAAMKRDRMSPDDIINAAKADPSVPQSLVDLAGDNTRAVAVQAQKRSNTARKTANDLWEDRVEGERDRHVVRLQEILNPDDKDILKTAKELADIRDARGRQNFPKALEGTISDVEVAKFFREPEVRRAYNEFRENQLTLANAGKIAMDEVPPEIYVYGTTKSGKKGVKLSTVDIPMKAFHVVQQAVNDAIQGGFKNGKTIPKGRARTLQAVLEKHMDTVENLNEDYGAARRVWRDDSAAMDALAAGRGKQIKNTHGRKIPNFKSSTSAELAEWMVERRAVAAAGGKAGEQAAREIENYMLGTFGLMRDQIKGKANSTNWLDLPAVKDKVRILFGGDTDKADEFVRALKAEQKIKGSSSAVRAGTAIQGDDAEIMPALDLMMGGAAAATGRPYAMLASIGRLVRGEHNMSEKTANATMDRLFKGVGGLEELIAGMESLKGARNAEIKRRARNVGVTAGVAAGATAGVSN